jgi:hypothetical protein
MAGIEFGHRFWDGSAGPEESRESAAAFAARFKPGFVEIVYRESPDASWVRDIDQPHTPDGRIDALADLIENLRHLVDWRGKRLVELGAHPNPPPETPED